MPVLAPNPGGASARRERSGTHLLLGSVCWRRSEASFWSVATTSPDVAQAQWRTTEMTSRRRRRR